MNRADKERGFTTVIVDCKVSSFSYVFVGAQLMRGQATQVSSPPNPNLLEDKSHRPPRLLGPVRSDGVRLVAVGALETSSSGQNNPVAQELNGIKVGNATSLNWGS